MAKHRLTKKLIKALKERDSAINSGYRDLDKIENTDEACILCCYLAGTADPTWIDGIVDYKNLMDEGQNWYCEDCQSALGYRW